ncbi:MAG: HU family DNA-binding protein [Candidatus Anammoxibacter sp.]
MHKSDLIDKIAKSTDYTKVSTAEIVNSLFETITQSLKKGVSVNILGFGSFKVVNLKARKGRDLQTGKEIKISARKAPKFKPSANLKALVRGKKK